MRCPSCQSEIAESQRFCGSCGVSLQPRSQRSTTTGPAAAHEVAAGRVSSDAIRGFTPGTILVDRYRIIGLLGRGGMGEVYRADDIRLGTPVALKFLPRALAIDPDRRERLLAEVRIARQITHPNVCRVFDIGETADGRQQFLSMEYIDGEDLASLLRRIGRLPPDKALDIARQICAGLSAAHERGVLHRDLKPANVMLDGRGRVRIMDFGLAAAADADDLDTDLSGTPAYMAPEQLAGHGASVQSDIYALGLVLHELYTGKRVYTATTFDALRAQKEQGAPAPSEFIPEMDPAVERVIRRAMAPDPRARPASVAQVAAALPGGDALAAALRAGETPSPEMVAAAGPREGLEPSIAWALVALVVVGAIVAASLAPQGLIWLRATPDTPPEVLASRAREMLARLGYDESAVDRASGYEADLEYLRYLRENDPVRSRWHAREPRFLRYWYRVSPIPLESRRFTFQYGNVSRIGPADPPMEIAGMALVRLDPTGRLTELVVVPPSTTDHGAPAPAPDWTALLAVAGFDPAAWTSTTPDRNPPVFADARTAWQGSWPGRPDLGVRLEAAGLYGRLVYFEAIFPWTRPPRTVAPMLTASERAGVAIVVVVLAVMLAGSVILAQRNVRAGRGDRRGALRLSTFVFAAMFVSWVFGESHVATLWEVAVVVMALSWALFAAAACGLAYLAAEPFLRRRWPEVLVTWARVVAGEFRDPLVGRDVLVGCAAGPWVATAALIGLLGPEWVGEKPDLVAVDVLGFAYGAQAVMPLLVWRWAYGVMVALACVFLLFLLRLAFRSQRVAVLTVVIACAAIMSWGASVFWISFLVGLVHTGVFVLLLVRFGLLAAVTQFYVWGLFLLFPITGDLSIWYAGAGVAALVVLAALTAYGFRTALGGRPALGTAGAC